MEEKIKSFLTELGIDLNSYEMEKGCSTDIVELYLLKDKNYPSIEAFAAKQDTVIGIYNPYKYLIMYFKESNMCHVIDQKANKRVGKAVLN